MSKAEYEAAFPDKPICNGAGPPGGWNKPVKSLSLACKRKDIKKRMALHRKHGVPTDYTPDGEPIIRSTAHQRELMKSLGVHNNDSYY